MRLIDADALTERLNDGILNDPNCPIFVAATVEQDIDHAPTVDAEPVRHGEWIETAYIDRRLCSLCEFTLMSYKKSNFCPNCGARMDGVKYDS